MPCRGLAFGIKPHYPIGLKTMLLWALPKKRPEERMKIFREFIRRNEWVRLGRQPTDNEFEWAWASVGDQFSEVGAALYIGELRIFAPKLGIERRRIRAQKAAAKRWERKKQPKKQKKI